MLLLQCLPLCVLSTLLEEILTTEPSRSFSGRSLPHMFMRYVLLKKGLLLQGSEDFSVFCKGQIQTYHKMGRGERETKTCSVKEN